MVEAYHITIIASLLEIFVILWCISQLNREIRENVEDLEESIDNKLALAIQSTGLSTNGEPVNPIQAAIAQMLTQATAPPVQVKEILVNRDDSGLFTKKD